MKRLLIQSTTDANEGMKPADRRMQFELSRDIAKLKEDVVNRFIFKQLNKIKQ